jgi:hypothetical protein
MKIILKILLLTTIFLTTQYSFAIIDGVKEVIVSFNIEPEEPTQHWKPVKVRVFSRIGNKSFGENREKESGLSEKKYTKINKNKINKNKINKDKINKLNSPLKSNFISITHGVVNGLGVRVNNFVRTTLKM